MRSEETSETGRDRLVKRMMMVMMTMMMFSLIIIIIINIINIITMTTIASFSPTCFISHVSFSHQSRQWHSSKCELRIWLRPLYSL